MKTKHGAKILIFGVGAVALIAFGVIVAFFANAPEYRGIETIATEPGITTDPYVEHIVNPDRSLFEGETLTIAQTFFASDMEPIARRYMAENPSVTVEVIEYFSYYLRDDHFGNATAEISTQLMSGGGPVLISGDLLDYVDPRSHPFLADWFRVMNADPGFNEADWFMNVFHATALDGRLYTFPTSFSYEAATANSEIPGLTEIMAGYDSITMPELLELHREIPTDEPLYFEMQTHINRLMPYYFKDFVDLDAGWVDFDNERFVELINYSKKIIETDRLVWGDMPSSRNGQRMMSETYFFHFADPSNYFYTYFLEFERSPIFTGLTPVVNSAGELLISIGGGNFILNANASPVEQALAWDFIKFMMNPDNRAEVIQGFMQPTNRELLRFGIETDISTNMEIAHIFPNREWPLAYTQEEAVDDVVSKMTAFGEMPMQNRRMLPNAIVGRPHGIIPVALQLFQDGLVSAEDTAANIQNQVELVLMELGAR